MNARPIIFFSLLLMIVTQSITAGTIVDGKALADEAQAANWLAYGRTYSEQRYSPLAQINTQTVQKLGVQWHLELPHDRSLISTPLVVDGTLYFIGSFQVLRAVNAKTGELRWEYDPEVIKHAGDRARIMWDWNRGIAYWKGRVFVATIDGRLIAVDAATGKEIWSVMTFDPDQPLFITGAPKVFNDKVIIGNGGTEWGPIRGFVTAYHTETGEEAWKFYTVPGNPADGFEDNAQAMAAKTWTGEWWKYGGGGTVWHGITYDPEYNHVYIGTGNGSPWNQKIRSPGGGDNLFLCAIVALDADTGKYRWHYQTTPGESWDYNSNMDILLVDLEVNKQTVKAMLHAPKNGFFYVINRANGKLLSAKPFGKVDWALGIDPKTGRPIEREGARYEDGEELVWPSAFGTHNWHAMSYSPDTALAYIPSIEMPGLFNDKGMDPLVWQSPYFKFNPGLDFLREDAPKDWGTGALRAWDPVRQKLVWEHPLPGVWNPGTMVTAGNLVFQGRADGKFVAYKADDGDVLWTYDMGSGISAPPITYAIDGQQYIALLVGWGGAASATAGSLAAHHGWKYRVHPRRLVAFTLRGDRQLPPSPPPSYAQPIDVADFKIDAELAEAGSIVWRESCGMCHGPGGTAGGYAPDLRASALMLDDKALHEIVFEGSRREFGMPNINDIDAAALKAVQHYIRKMARQSLQAAK